MRKEHLKNMTKGWFVGNFIPSLYITNDVEVGIKSYKVGSYEKLHFHKIATEITVIVSGEVEMSGQHYKQGDMIVIEPEESTDFLALTDVTTVVVKLPGANNDKYLCEEENA